MTSIGMTNSPPRVQAAVERSRLQRYCHVIYALIMHDIKNRFFGSGLGQIAMFAWPFVHIIVLIVIGHVTNRPHRFGDSNVQYVSVSILPFIIFNYVGRWITMAAQSNKSFLNYPVIQPLDLLVARACLELINMTVVTIMLVVVLIVCGADPMPTSPMDAAEAWLATACLAVGFGLLNAPFTFIMPMWTLVVTLLILISYAASGCIFVAADLPAQVREPLSYNPLLHCTEWLRLSYYNDYPNSILDKQYVLYVSLIMASAGLILMRVFRRLF